MKKIFYGIAMVAGIAGMTACNDKLEIAAPYKNITVVYGMLSMSDTAHYIRIQKAFMDGNKSAIDMAKVADSSFYKVLDVSIKELSAGGAVIGAPIKLEKIDLALEGYPKDTGVFFNTPSYAYKFKKSLDATRKYRLVILNTETGVVDSAETAIIDNTVPNTEFGIREWFDATITMSFAKAGQKFDYTASIPSSVYAAELIVRFNWVDSNIVTHTSVPYTADFSLGNPDVVAGKPTVFNTKQKESLYYFFRDVLKGAPEADHYRYFKDSCNMMLYAAGEEYAKYVKLNQVSGGLTANEIRPVYTSIKGPDVLGLMSTRAYREKQLFITEDSQDALNTNSITSDLGIRFK